MSQFNFSATATPFIPQEQEYVSIPVSQYRFWQKQFEEAQVELRKLRKWKEEVLENPESMSSKLDAAKRRGDSLAHMRQALRYQLDRKMRVAKEEAEELRTKLLKKGEQLDRTMAAAQEASRVAKEEKAEADALRKLSKTLEGELAEKTDLFEHYRREYMRRHEEYLRAEEANARLRERLMRIDPELEKWQGISVRLNWIIKEMEKVGAIRLPDHEWATEMRHTIEYPDDDGVDQGESIMNDLPYAIRRDNLPNYNDGHMEIVNEEEEDEIYAVLSAEAARHVEVERRKAALIIQKMWRGYIARRVSDRLRQFVDEEPIIWEQRGCQWKATITIQKMWRGYIGRRDANREWWKEQTPTNGELAAITIQKMWRGYLGRILPLRQIMRIDELYNMRAAITIQKMWRGFYQRNDCDLIMTRAHRAYVATRIQCAWRGYRSRGIINLNNTDWHRAAVMWASSSINDRWEHKTAIRFINTGDHEYKWEKLNNEGMSLYEDEGRVKPRSYTEHGSQVRKIQFVRGHSIFIGASAKPTQCFRITNLSTGVKRYIRVPFVHGAQHSLPIEHRVSIYDVETGITRPCTHEVAVMFSKKQDAWDYPPLA